MRRVAFADKILWVSFILLYMYRQNLNITMGRLKGDKSFIIYLYFIYYLNVSLKRIHKYLNKV